LFQQDPDDIKENENSESECTNKEVYENDWANKEVLQAIADNKVIASCNTLI